MINVLPYEIFEGCGVPVTLPSPHNFLKVKETLTRIGVSAPNNVLYSSANILHKRGLYAIVHFKEMFILDGKSSSMNKIDYSRRNTICALLEEWGLIEVVNPDSIIDRLPVKSLKIVNFKDKKDWKLVSKYDVGAKRL